MDQATPSAPTPPLTEFGAEWFDPLEAAVRGQVRAFIERLLEKELEAALGLQRARHRRAVDQGRQNALRWTRLSCHAFQPNAVRLQLHALAYNVGNFMRTLTLPEKVEQWSLTTLREKLVKIGARIVRHGRYVVFQLPEEAVPRAPFAEILGRIDRFRPRPLPLPA